jgi:hypothetical protein
VFGKVEVQERVWRSSLRSWAERPPGTLTRQRELVCRMFSSREQLEEFIVLYWG